MAAIIGLLVIASEFLMVLRPTSMSSFFFPLALSKD